MNKSFVYLGHFLWRMALYIIGISFAIFDIICFFMLFEEKARVAAVFFIFVSSGIVYLCYKGTRSKTKPENKAANIHNEIEAKNNLTEQYTNKTVDIKQFLSKDIGQSEAKCPYCEYMLTKFPQKKTKCPKCSNDIYVRTRPFDRAKILVKDDELKNIEQEWNRLKLLNEYYTSDYNIYEEKYKNEKNVKEVVFEEVIIYKYKTILKKMAKESNWYNYIIENIKLRVLYCRLQNFLEALKCELENEYIQFCRPVSIYGETGFLSKDIYQGEEYKIMSNNLDWLIKEIDLSLEEVKILFYNLDIHKSYQFPHSKEIAWELCFYPYLKNNIKIS